jgi:hypothetical protein
MVERFDRLRGFFKREDDGLRAPWRVFWVAFVVRVLYVLLAHTWRVKPLEDHFAFGFEAGRIARALVTGYGYADPFANAFLSHSGPTAWLPPLYPLLMAAVFKGFGVYTGASAFVLLAINCAASAATAMACWELGARFAGVPVGRWAGWLWALYPAAMQYAVKWFWEMTVTTALFTWVVVLAMRMRAEPERRTIARWCWFGAAWGLIGLSNSTLLLFLPVCGLWVLWGRVNVRQVAAAMLATLVFAGLLAPWMVRNERVFHRFIPMRGNLGAELYLGNGPGANGLLMEHNHPFQSAQQMHLYAAMGEVAYVRMRGDAAKRTIAADPWLFVRNTLKRMDFFWFSVPHDEQKHEAGEWVRVEDYAFLSVAGLLGLGLALWRRLPGAGLWAWAFVLLPLPYYPVTVHARFRHPLEPMICVLVVYLFRSAEHSNRRLG